MIYETNLSVHDSKVLFKRSPFTFLHLLFLMLIFILFSLIVIHKANSWTSNSQVYPSYYIGSGNIININIGAPDFITSIGEGVNVYFSAGVEAGFFFRYNGLYFNWINNGWKYSNYYYGPWLPLTPVIVLPPPLLYGPPPPVFAYRPYFYWWRMHIGPWYRVYHPGWWYRHQRYLNHYGNWRRRVIPFYVHHPYYHGGMHRIIRGRGGIFIFPKGVRPLIGKRGRVIYPHNINPVPFRRRHKPVRFTPVNRPLRLLHEIKPVKSHLPAGHSTGPVFRGHIPARTIHHNSPFPKKTAGYTGAYSAGRPHGAYKKGNIAPFRPKKNPYNNNPYKGNPQPKNPYQINKPYRGNPYQRKNPYSVRRPNYSPAYRPPVRTVVPSVKPYYRTPNIVQRPYPYHPITPVYRGNVAHQRNNLTRPVIRPNYSRPVVHRPVRHAPVHIKKTYNKKNKEKR